MTLARRSLGASDLTWSEVINGLTNNEPVVLIPGIGPLIAANDMSQIAAANAQAAADTGATPAPAASSFGGLGLSDSSWLVIGLLAVLGIVVIARK